MREKYLNRRRAKGSFKEELNGRFVRESDFGPDGISIYKFGPALGSLYRRGIVVLRLYSFIFIFELGGILYQNFLCRNIFLG